MADIYEDTAEVAEAHNAVERKTMELVAALKKHFDLCQQFTKRHGGRSLLFEAEVERTIENLRNELKKHVWSTTPFPD
jgi:hypothetical protein